MEHLFIHSRPLDGLESCAATDRSSPYSECLRSSPYSECLGCSQYVPVLPGIPQRSSMGGSVDIWFTVVFPLGCPGISACHPDHVLHLLCWPWRLQDCFSHFFQFIHYFLCSVLPFLKYIFMEARPALLMGSVFDSSESVGGWGQALFSGAQ